MFPNVDDPNTIYLASLNSGAQEEYSNAYGHRILNMDTGEYEEFGCSPEAIAKYPQPVQPESGTSEFDSLVNSIDTVKGRKLAEDPRMIELNQEWTQCMNDNEYQFAEFDKGAKQSYQAPRLLWVLHR